MVDMSTSKMLLRGGVLLLHDANNHVVPTKADLLIEGQLISRIAEKIDVGSDVRVIDCQGKIVSPGFIDTHRHLWQTQYKGAHADQSLIEYLPRGNAGSVLWSVEDLFWGQLSGALESIEAGTTTLVDHSHCNVTPDYPQAATQALLSSGIRAVYCYCPPLKLKSREPWASESVASDETFADYQKLARGGPYGGRVHIGYANDDVYSPGEVLKPLYAKLRNPAQGRAQVITTHTIGGPMQGENTPSAAQLLERHGLLGPDVLLSHANWPRDGDGALYARSGACTSSTPNTELQMGRLSVALREDHYETASIGVDCHSWGVAGIPGQMRLMLQAARGGRGEDLTRRGQWTRRVGFAAEQVFNLGTLGGARACGLEKEIGSLREGLKADVVVFDGETPSMLAAAEEDPVAAIVLHSNPGDIDMVIIDGALRKQGGKLVDVSVAAAPDVSRSLIKPGKKITWKEVARSVLESRSRLLEREKGIDFKAAEDTTIDGFYLNRKALLEDQ